MAFTEFYGQWHQKSAFAEFQRSVELDGKSAEAHHWFANALFTIRDLPAAWREIQKARELEPNSAAILADSFLIESEMPGRRDSSIGQLRELERSEPAFSSPPRYLAQIMLDSTQYADYVAELERTAALSHSPADVQLAQAAAAAWRYGGATALLQANQRFEAQQYRAGQTSGYGLALASARLGDSAAALRYLEAAYRRQDFMVITVLSKNDPVNTAIRALPGFQNLQRNIEAQLQQ